MHEAILNWLGWVHLEFRGAAINVHAQQWVLDMIVSQKGDPNVDPKYYNPDYRDPIRVPLILGNPHIHSTDLRLTAHAPGRAEGRVVPQAMAKPAKAFRASRTHIIS